jgi:UPF0271 protein
MPCSLWGAALVGQPVAYRQSVRIDLNADLGEGFGIWRLTDDMGLLDVVTSANVACGFHAGDAVTMSRVCEQASRRGVAIGAQVGYRDLAGFGRRRIDMPLAELQADVLYQLGALDVFARAAGTRVAYVKAHGALYNMAADDPAVAGAIVAALSTAARAYERPLPLLGLAGSALQAAAIEAGIPFVAEAFADRRYTADGRLMPRSSLGAVVEDEREVLAQARSIVLAGRVRTIEGGELDVVAQSLCLHGDTAGAVALAGAIRTMLQAAGVAVAPFADRTAPAGP